MAIVTLHGGFSFIPSPIISWRATAHTLSKTEKYPLRIHVLVHLVLNVTFFLPFTCSNRLLRSANAVFDVSQITTPQNSLCHLDWAYCRDPAPHTSLCSCSYMVNNCLCPYSLQTYVSPPLTCTSDVVTSQNIPRPLYLYTWRVTFSFCVSTVCNKESHRLNLPDGILISFWIWKERWSPSHVC